MRYDLVVDVDGVLLDYLVGYLEFALKHGHAPAIPHHDSEDFSMGDIYPHVEYARRRELMHAYGESPDFARIPEITGARSALRRLRSEVPNTRITAVTSCGGSDATKSFRYKNLAPLGIDHVIFLPFNGEKTSALAKFAHGTPYLDDRGCHVAEAKSVSLAAKLFRQPHNRHDKEHEMIADWDEGVAMVLDAWSKQEMSISAGMTASV